VKKIVLGISGSSGAIYAANLIKKFESIKDQIELGIVASKNALINWELEVGPFDKSSLPFKLYDSQDFYAPFASGSALYNHMVVCPCSMGTLSRIATGHSNDLLTRAADVVLKERRQLILVTRETPLSLIHINNMKTVTEAGGLIMPACPSFYADPKDINDVVDSVTDRIIDQLGLNHDTYRWGESS
jgi:4-hydroxy-3-polyprenylbenzoate decarboxylase